MKRIAASLIIAVVIIGGIVAVLRSYSEDANNTSPNSNNTVIKNPLANRKLYIDNSREITNLAKKYTVEGDTAKAKLIEKISTQPGTTWLFGPSSSDPTSLRDIAEVTRTSTEAAKQGTIPVYQLYAIPGRDACAAYSKGGFTSNQQYLAWLDQIIGELKSDAVFSVEADAVAQTVRGDCMSQQQIKDRYELLRLAMTRLSDAPHVLATYLDAGHPEWFADPNVLVEPLRQSGIDKARGIAVNVSFFTETSETTKWAQKLVGLLGGEKGAIIDTSRNGKGAPPASASGEARWCNPPGRGLGPRPSTQVQDAGIDAYFWGKIIGESDGSCFGNPPAGVFMPEAALELARHAAE